MSTRRLLFQRACTIKNLTMCVGLIQSGHHHHLIKCKLFSLWFSWSVAHLTLNNNRSLTLGRLDYTNDSSRCSSPWVAPSSTYVDRIIYDRVWCQTGQYDCVWRTRIYAKGRNCVRFNYFLRRIPCKTLLWLLYMTGFLKRAGRHFRPVQNKVELINIERRIVKEINVSLEPTLVNDLQ